MTKDQASAFAKLALKGIQKEYPYKPGVVLNGKLAFVPGKLPLAFVGTVRVSGSKAVAGTLKVTRTRLTGTLGGRKVSVAL